MSRKWMSRLWIPALAAALGLAVSGCGVKVNASDAGTGTAVNAAAAEEQEKAEKTILVLDDDTARIVCTGLFQISPDEKDMGEEDLKAGISFEVTNKIDREIIVDVRGLKVGTQNVSRKLLEGDVIKPGTTQVFRYGILEPVPESDDGVKAEKTNSSLNWETVTEQGITGTIQVLDLSGELAKAEFAMAE